MEQMLSPEFWLAVGQIIMIDILLGGDNAVVIALACHQLPAHLRRQGVLWGTLGAIVLRIVLVFFALTLLGVPYLKLAGAALLLWIGVKLLASEEDDDHQVQASDRLWTAVRTIIVADFVMSVDNVIAVAGAAQNAGGAHQMPLVIFGLLVSIPLIVWGSQVVMGLMERFPIVVTLGAMLLGWIAGQMAITDPAWAQWGLALPQPVPALWQYGCGALGAVLVPLLARWVALRGARAPSSSPEAR